MHMLVADSIPETRFARPTAAGLSDRAKRQNHNPETKKAALGGFLQSSVLNQQQRLYPGADGETRTLTPCGAGT